MILTTQAIVNVDEEFRVLTRNLQETVDLQDEKLQHLAVFTLSVTMSEPKKEKTESHYVILRYSLRRIVCCANRFSPERSHVAILLLVDISSMKSL